MVGAHGTRLKTNRALVMIVRGELRPVVAEPEPVGRRRKRRSGGRELWPPSQRPAPRWERAYLPAGGCWRVDRLGIPEAWSPRIGV